MARYYSYTPEMGIIPGYDAITRYVHGKQAYRDWQKNVGSKGRYISYAYRRPDFGSARTAFKEITSSVSDMMSGDYLPW